MCDRGSPTKLILPTAAYGGTKFLIDNVLNTATTKIYASPTNIAIDSAIFAITSFLYDYLWTMKGANNIQLNSTCTKCLIRNVAIIVVELLLDYWRYSVMPNITVILGEIVSVFNAELVEKNLPSLKN